MIHPKNVEDTQQQFESPYIKPGLHNNIKVTKVEYFDNEGQSTPRLVFHFEDENGKTLEDNAFFLSENAEEYTVKRLKHLAKAMDAEDDLNKIYDKAEDYKQVVKGLNTKFTEKNIPVMKFGGQEIQANSEEKQNWVKAKVPFFPPFASDDPENYQFSYDENKDIEWLETTNSDEVVMEEQSNEDDDLGF